METIKNILNNPWVITIGSGIIVSIIGGIITNIIIKKINKNEFDSNIKLANGDIIKIIKPYVTEEKLIDNLLIDSIRNAIARKYNCNPDSLLSDIQICEELICEILNESFLTVDNKKTYINRLEMIILQSKQTIIKDKINELRNEWDNYDLNSKRKRRYFETLILVAMTIIVMYSIIITKSPRHMYFDDNIVFLIIAFAFTVYSLMICIYLVYTKKKIGKKK